jgi:SAM-dependent methyltransferase
VSLLAAVHGQIYERRLRVLADRIAAMLPAGATVLDIGCGDGALSRQVMARRPDVHVEGVDVLVRQSTHISVTPFDGVNLPLPDRSVDVAVIVDVLHHAEHPITVLREAARVARTGVVVKDHLADRLGAVPVLRLMDWVGNARYGVRLPYTYWKRTEWSEMFDSAGLEPQQQTGDLPLYPFPLSLVFGAQLHFLALLSPCRPPGSMSGATRAARG